LEGPSLGKNRDRLNITACILLVANSGASKTHIMKKANLSYMLLEKYLSSVVGSDLLRLEGSRYMLTENGRVFLKRYNDYHERCMEAERDLESLSSEREKLCNLCEAPRLPEPIAAAQ
jgi:predicted transcriptional regulator